MSKRVNYEDLFDIPERVIPVDPDLKIREELIGLHAMNASLPENSASRMYMFSSHFAQALSILNGDSAIWQTGLEQQFSKNTFACRAPADCTVLRVISRYGNYSSHRAKNITEIIVLVLRHDTREIDCIVIPYYHTLHQYFGFKYEINKDLFSDLGRSTVLKKGQALADAPTVGPNDTYNYGVNANIALMPLPEVAEDGVLISDELSEKLTYKVFEKRIMGFGADKIPLNIYGDLNTYKPFPDIGEKINPASIVMALRTYDPDLAPSLFTQKSLMEYDPNFDEMFCVKGPGADEIIDGYVVESGIVVDIKAYHSPRFKKNIFTGTGDVVKKYVDGYQKFNEDLINAYNDICAEFRSLYGNEEIRTSEQLNSLMIKAYAITNTDKNKIAFCFRKDPLDIMRVEVTIEYTLKCKTGAKISDLAGSKGVIVHVKPREEMPIDIYGQKSVVVMDHGAVISRMNSGRLYGLFFAAASRHTQYMVKKWLTQNRSDFPTKNTDALPDKLWDRNVETQFNIKPLNQYSDEVINCVFDIITGFTAAFNTAQFTYYSNTTDRAVMENVINDVVTKEAYFFYNLSADRTRYQVAIGICKSIYKPIRDVVKFISNGEEFTTKKPVRIAPQYTILLGKTADNFLSTPSAKTNHFGLGVGIPSNQRHRKHWKDSAVKNISETEGRLFAGYADPDFIAELLDQANKNVNRQIYGILLRADRPTDIPRLIDRAKQPYVVNSALRVIESVFECNGTALGYSRDKRIMHKP